MGALVYSFEGTPWAHCTATLIAPRAVLTAAHCVTSAPEGQPLGFFSGDELLAAASASRTVGTETRHTHPDYDPEVPVPADVANYRDIAVIMLSAAPPGVVPLRLPRPEDATQGALTVGAGVTLVGFGRTELGDPQSAGTRQVGTSAIHTVADYEFRIHQSDAAQKCLGDSGAPTLRNVGTATETDWRLVGVSSRAGDGCAGGSVETRVDVHLPWIHEVVDLPCGSGLSAPCQQPDAGPPDAGPPDTSPGRDARPPADLGTPTADAGEPSLLSGGCIVARSGPRAPRWLWLLSVWALALRRKMKNGDGSVFRRPAHKAS